MAKAATLFGLSPELSLTLGSLDEFSASVFVSCIVCVGLMTIFVKHLVIFPNPCSQSGVSRMETVTPNRRTRWTIQCKTTEKKKHVSILLVRCRPSIQSNLHININTIFSAKISNGASFFSGFCLVVLELT